MTLLEFAQQERDARLKEPKDWDSVAGLCQQQGYYVIPEFLFGRIGSSVIVTVHDYPDPAEENRYMHRHDFFELIYVYQGAYCSRMEDHDIEMNSGDMMLLNTNVLHSPFLRSRDDIVFNILIKKQLVQDQLLPLMASNRLLFPFFFNCLHSGTPVKESLLFRRVSQAVRSLADQLIGEYIAQDMYYQHTMSAMILLLLFLLSREYRPAHAPRSSADDSLVFESLLHDYLNHHMSSATLFDAAEKLTYTPAYLSRKIRNLTGITFTELLTDYRIRKACQLLHSTNLPLDAIAVTVGYVNASHFIRKFKGKMKVTPGDYRKRKS